MNNEIVIVINPGSTSTKIALYNRKGEILSESITHKQSDLDKFNKVSDQLDYRYKLILKFVTSALKNKNYKVVGIVGRGGIVKPLEGGTYRINKNFLEDAFSGKYGEHASNMGTLLADKLKNVFGLKNCYTVDPVSASAIPPIAEISGVPKIIRDGRGHPLNMKMTGRKIAKVQNILYEKTNYIVAHLGGGISIALIQGGKFIDINDGLLGMGPFSPNRAGALPLRGVIDLCYKMQKHEVEKLLSKNSGFKAYLGTEDIRDVMKMIKKNNKHAKLIYDAFVFQVAKNIGACFAISKGKAQAIIVTGGIAHNKQFTDDLKKYVGSLTEYFVYPGENEMEALAEGIFRVINGEEAAKEY
jgi:butyrate kinase